MTTATDQQATCVPKPPPDPMDPSMENDIAQFVRLDTEMKRARKQMQDVRKTVDMHRHRILEYMVGAKIDKLVGINGGTQYLECFHKVLKRRPTSEQILAKIAELMKAGVTDPAVMLEAIQNCGGTYSEYRLSRRTCRLNAATIAAAAAATIKGGKKKLRKPGIKKRKQTVSESIQQPTKS